MGSSLSKIRDMEEEQIQVDGELWLSNLSNDIINTNVFSSDFYDLQWLIKNKEKILRNKNLINLLG